MRSVFTWLLNAVLAVVAVLAMLLLMAVLGPPHDWE